MEIITDMNNSGGDAIESPLFTAKDMDNSGSGKILNRTYIVVGIFAAVCVAVNMVISLSRGENPAPATILTILIFALYIGESLINQKTRNKTSYNVFSFYNDRYVNADRLSQTTVPYELMIKAVETADSFYLFLEPNRAHVVLKSTITRGNAESLSLFLQGKIKNYKSKVTGQKKPSDNA